MDGIFRPIAFASLEIFHALVSFRSRRFHRRRTTRYVPRSFLLSFRAILQKTRSAGGHAVLSPVDKISLGEAGDVRRYFLPGRGSRNTRGRKIGRSVAVIEPTRASHRAGSGRCVRIVPRIRKLIGLVPLALLSGRLAFPRSAD